jgi:cytidyltransferase-like protein
MTVGCIHGRFQPFHNGHYEYLLAASRKCDRLIIGITQYEAEMVDNGSPTHRMHLADNPFTYWERLRVIKAVLANAADIDVEADVVPYPIQAPNMIQYFVDPRAIMFTTIYDEWNMEKVRRIEEQGFVVDILWKRSIKEIEGKKVRAAMRQDWSLFSSMVPKGVTEVVKEIKTEREFSY